jgi:hypothetical protein
MILAVEVFGLALVAAVARRQSGNAALACGKDKRPPEVLQRPSCNLASQVGLKPTTLKNGILMPGV